MQKTHIWEAPAGYRFEITLSRSSYRVEIFKRDQRKGNLEFVHRSGKTRRLEWGASLTDALSSACYTGNPERALAGMGYLFNRIDPDFDGDRTLYRDLFAEAKYVGETEQQRHERWQPYRDAMQRAHDLRFSGGWSAANTEAQVIKADLQREDAAIDGGALQVAA